jgi:hypothetical protein
MLCPLRLLFSFNEQENYLLCLSICVVILNFPAIRQVSNIESLIIAGNGRFWAGNDIRRDGLQWRNFWWCLYILYVVPPPYGICTYLLFKVRICVTYEDTKLHLVQRA